MLEVERRAVLAGVDQQRLESHGFVTSERLALVAAMREERLALVAALRQERIEAIAGIDAIKTRAVEASLAGLRDLVDYAFWRVAVLLASLLCVAGAVRCDRALARRCVALACPRHPETRTPSRPWPPRMPPGSTCSESGTAAGVLRSSRA